MAPEDISCIPLKQSKGKCKQPSLKKIYEILILSALYILNPCRAFILNQPCPCHPPKL